MITIFWDFQGLLLLGFLPKRETINSARYQETLKKLTRSIRRKRPDLQDVMHDRTLLRPLPLQLLWKDGLFTTPSVQSWSGIIRLSPVWPSEILPEGAEFWRWWICEGGSEGVDPTVLTRILRERISKTDEPDGRRASHATGAILKVD